MMKESVSKQTQLTYAAYTGKPRVEWVLDWLGMGIIAVDQIYWTRETEHALDTGGNKGLKEYEAQCTKQLDDMVLLVRTPISKLQRYTLGAMVTLDVHGRDVLTFMVGAGVDTSNDFNWVSQLRYYYDPNGEDGITKGPDILIKIITSTAKFGWEYLGNSFRLVVTGLTDRCYRTLMSALQLTLGGAPGVRPLPRGCPLRRRGEGTRRVGEEGPLHRAPHDVVRAVQHRDARARSPLQLPALQGVGAARRARDHRALLQLCHVLEAAVLNGRGALGEARCGRAACLGRLRHAGRSEACE